MNKKIHKLKWYDIGILKIDIILFVLLLAQLFPVLTKAHRIRYAVGVAICELYLGVRILGKKKHK